MPLSDLRSQGLRVTTAQGLLLVEPRDRLTDALRTYIRAHKAALIQDLADEADARLEPLKDFREALMLGRLVICGNCAHFAFGADPADLGQCARYAVEALPFAPFQCEGFEVATTPAAPLFLPDPTAAQALARMVQSVGRGNLGECGL